ncbi:MAG: TonB-dependent receptor [Acidobacteria bacterium]|nr:TonB-dependent receptor [Acidobacteriota bacterium]
MKSTSFIIKRVFTQVLILSLILTVPLSLTAQETRGAIIGRVMYGENAVIPGAPVKIINLAMGTTVTLMTNETGFFKGPYLIPGIYQLVVELPGFKRYVRDGVVLRIGQTIDTVIQLEVGITRETVTVVVDTPPIETATSSLAQIVDNRRITELPLTKGDPYKMIGLSPGVAFGRDQRLDRPFEPTHIVGFTFNGTRANRSDLTIDGVSSTATANANEVIATYVPPTDIIQEFKVQTVTYDAQFGNTEGGVTSIGIKAGGNAFHGSGYFFGEPGRLAANDFFGNLQNQPRPQSYSNRFGGTISGPVFIPKTYNGRDRTFFLFGYEGIRDSRPRFDSTTPTVPTEKMKRGDFSDFLKLGEQFRIYNPFTRTADPVTGMISQEAFANNIIPDNLINPVSRALLQYFPTPKSAGTTADFLNNNRDSTLPEKTRLYNNFTFRIDHVIGEKHRIFARGSYYDRDSFYNDYFNNIATGTNFKFFSRQGVIDDVYFFNPTTILNLRYGYNRFVRCSDMAPGALGFDLTSLGFPAAYNNLIDDTIRRFPRLDFPAGTYQGTGQNNEVRPIDTHSFSSTVTKTFGAHSLKTGMELRVYRENSLNFSNSYTGQFVFDNTFVKQTDLANAPQVALSFAAFLLGVPTTGRVVQGASYAEQSSTWGFFIHDDWNVNSRLTLNLGLRYELETGMTERFNRSITGFDLGYIQPIEAAVRATYASLDDPLKADLPQINARGGLLFAGMDGRALYQTPKRNFMPRIGFAYKLSDKTLVRGGYGIFYGFLGQRRSDVIQTGFTRITDYVPSLDGVTYTGNFSNPFPNGLIPPPGSSLGPQSNLGRDIAFFNQQPKTPFNQRFDLGIQRELNNGFLVEASYVGNRGSDIEINRDLNALPNKYLSTSPVRDEAKNSYLRGLVANPFFGLIQGIGDTMNISRMNLLKPFPQFGQVITTTNDGYSWYHSGQLRVEKRFTRGYTLQASYTYSKFMQAIEYLNPADPIPYRSISDQDYPHRFAVNGIAELPFGKGQKLLGNTNGIISKLISGWQMQGVYAFQSGAPLRFNVVTNSTATSGYIFNGDFGDLVMPSDQRSREAWFNTNGFVAQRGLANPTVPAGPANPIIVRTNSDGTPVWVDFNDPCKNSYNPTSCPGSPLANPTGFNRDTAYQLVYNLRNFPLRFSNLRVQSTNNVDFSFVKNTDITETTRLQLRAEFLNMFNHPWLSAASGASGTAGVITTPTTSNFGQISNISNQANYPRRVQLGAKFIF